MVDDLGRGMSAQHATPRDEVVWRGDPAEGAATASLFRERRLSAAGGADRAEDVRAALPLIGDRGIPHRRALTDPGGNWSMLRDNRRRVPARSWQVAMALTEWGLTRNSLRSPRTAGRKPHRQRAGAL